MKHWSELGIRQMPPMSTRRRVEEIPPRLQPYVDERTVDVHIRRLRQAINIAGAPDMIRTVRAAGYALQAESD